jgi:hypothetical protein
VPTPLGNIELSSYFLAVKYVSVVLFMVWLAFIYRYRHPAVLFVGAVFFALLTWFAGELPLKRLYAFAPLFDRMFNVAMGATSATGHSAFESYQVASADLEPFWRVTLRLLSGGKPENVLAIYPYLAPAAMVLLSLCFFLALGRRGAKGENRDRYWEAALVVYCVLLLNSTALEPFGVFDSFWSMTLLLKPNHVLGFILIPLWIRAWTSRRSWVRTWGAGVLLGILAWVFLMHWSYVLVGLACFPLVARWTEQRPEVRRVVVVTGMSLLAALPYLLFLFSNFHWGHGGAVAKKIWLQLGYEEGYINFFSVSYEHGVLFLLSLVGVVGMAVRRRREDVVWLALLLGVVVGWIGYLVTFALQKIIEPDEFYFYTRFLLSVSAGSGAFFLLKWLEPTSRPFSPRWIPMFLLLTLPHSIPYWWNPPLMDRYYHFSLDALPDEMVALGRWVRDETSRDAVFVAGGQTSLWIASLAGRRVLTTGHHRPPYDYEERRALENRMLVGREAEAFREAVRQFKVTHIAIEPDYLTELGADANELEKLPWLGVVYEGAQVRVLAIQERDLAALDRFGES